MTPDTLRKLRDLVDDIYPEDRQSIHYKDEALALIDAELAKPEVCVWKRDVPLMARSCADKLYNDSRARCPDCGKRVEVRP